MEVVTKLSLTVTYVAKRKINYRIKNVKVETATLTKNVEGAVTAVTVRQCCAQVHIFM